MNGKENLKLLEGEYRMLKIDFTTIEAAAQSILDIVDQAQAAEAKERSALAHELSNVLGVFRAAALCPVWLEEQHAIYTGEEAVRAHVAVNAPRFSSPARYLKSMRTYAESLRYEFRTEAGELISEAQVRAVMDYLDTAFDFSDLVYGRKATFAILSISNDEYAAMHTLLKNTNGELRFHISLFNTLNNEQENSPEFVLFHELGVGLYASIVNRSNTAFVAKEVVQQLKPMFPSIERLHPAAQIAVIADVIAVGLMRGSLYEAKMAGRLSTAWTRRIRTSSTNSRSSFCGICALRAAPLRCLENRAFGVDYVVSGVICAGGVVGDCAVLCVRWSYGAG